MARFRLTLTLTAAAVASLATAAVASPDTSPPMHLGASPASSVHTADGGMAAMHAQMVGGDMATMHAQMADGGMTTMHAQMAATPEMLEHLAAFGVDPDEMAGWMAEGRDWSDVHDELADRGVDVEAMMATCPMLEGSAVGHRPGSMAGDQHARHHP